MIHLGNPFVAAALVMVMALTVTVLADLFHNGATVRDLAHAFSRDRAATALMLLVVYASCYLVVNVATAAWAFFTSHA